MRAHHLLIHLLLIVSVKSSHCTQMKVQVIVAVLSVLILHNKYIPTFKYAVKQLNTKTVSNGYNDIKVSKLLLQNYKYACNYG